MSDLGDLFYKGPSITLGTGREITLQLIDQGMAYAHILEGIPWGPNFDDLVNTHLNWAQKRYPNIKAIMLPPRLRPLPTINEKTPGDLVHVGTVCCRALFESNAIADDAWKVSTLIVLWFQDGFAWPIDSNVVKQIKAIDWDSEAIDVDCD